MLDIEALKARPKIKVTLPPEQLLPIVTDEEIVAVTSQKIEKVKKAAESSFRSPLRLWHDPSHQLLFSVAAENKYSSLLGVGDTVNARVIGRVESTRMQQIIFGVMQKYGLDETLSVPDPSMSWKGSEDGIHHGGFIATEWRAFPSTLHRGLEFSRARSYIEATGETVSFAWHVSDDLAPVNKIGPVRVFAKEVGKALQLINQQAAR